MGAFGTTANPHSTLPLSYTLPHSQRSRIAYRHELVDLSCPGEQRDVFRQCLRRLGLVRPSLRGVQLREAVEAGRDVTVARRQRPLLG